MAFGWGVSMKHFDYPQLPEELQKGLNDDCKLWEQGLKKNHRHDGIAIESAFGSVVGIFGNLRNPRKRLARNSKFWFRNGA